MSFFSSLKKNQDSDLLIFCKTAVVAVIPNFKKNNKNFL